MKILKLLLSIGLFAGIFFSCADYDLMEQSLHPDGVTLSIVNVSDTSVTLRWTRYSGEDFKRYSVYCSRSDVIDTTDSLCDTLLFSIDTAKTVRGLTVGTLYYFRVMVTTKTGGVGASNIVDTTTVLSMKGKLKLAQPDTAAVTDSTVILRWSSCVSLFDAYKIYMDTAPNVDTKDTLMRTVYDDTLAAMRGLDPGRDYWFRVYAVLDTTIVGVSSVMQTRTTDHSVGEPVLSIAGKTDTTMLLRWSQYHGSDFRNYKIYFSLEPTVEPGDSLKDSLAVRTDTMALIKNLLPGVSCTFRVMVTRKRGEPVYSNNSSAMTTNVRKTQIRLFGPDIVTDSLVHLRWTKCNFEIDSYRILKGFSAQVDTLDSIAAIKNDAADTTTVIKGLSGSTTYWFRVFARKAGEYVASSNPIEVLTGNY